MKIVVMATGPFSVPMIRAVSRSSHVIQTLITKPERDRPGKKGAAIAPAKKIAEEFDLPILTPHSANDPDFITQLKSLAPDVLLVCDYGQILSAETLAAARLGGLNLHGSLLPAYRGAAPVQWAIYRGETETGVSVIHMTPKLDAGPIVCHINVTMDPQETAAQLEWRLAELGAPLVLQALEILAAWDGSSPLGIPQDPQRISTARRLRKEDAVVDWNRSAQEIWNQVKAFDPWPGAVTAFTDAKGTPQTLRLVEVNPLKESRTMPPGPVPSQTGVSGASSPKPGTIHITSTQNLFVSTGDGWLELKRVIPANRKEISGAEFVRGYRLKIGDKLVHCQN